MGVCGACTVLVDNMAFQACQIPLSAIGFPSVPVRVRIGVPGAREFLERTL
ncbi:hypothetical protein [Paraburkholderia oxyphila]|uniref:hypothetical protein n=1 Tax=Paraburkholderia oxyphila TaxID=614212 RepID=UPI003899068C